MNETLLVMGASARAAAFSASRAGFTPVAADLFGDADLVELCSGSTVRDYPAGLAEAAAAAPPGPWLYTGALENHPALVDRIAATRPLYGNSGDVLRRVRNPRLVADALHADGLNCPAVCTSHPPPSSGQWLRKPLRSCGGGKIELVTGRDESADDASAEPDFFYQQFIAGTPVSATYVAAGGRATLLGVTQQLIGCDWTGASGFRYTGSLGPLVLDVRTKEIFQRIGNCLARRFQLRGLFGVDAIKGSGVFFDVGGDRSLSRSSVSPTSKKTPDPVFPVEVNPRYTASVEVLERGLGVQAIALHVSACRDGVLPQQVIPASGYYCGKAIVFARTDVEVTGDFSQLVSDRNANHDWPVIADVPHTGDRISAGHPITTVLAAGESLAAVEQHLRQLVRRVQETLKDLP
jgi:predicted ATP-grasp superfamily ATP-dependent carboligase